LTKDLERIKFLKVLLLDGCKQAQDASLTIEKETAILLHDDGGLKEKHAVDDKITIEKDFIVSDKRVKTSNSSTQTADSAKSIKIKMVDKCVQTLDLINNETMVPPVKRKMVETRNEYSSAPGQTSTLKKVAFMNNPADENMNSSATNISKSSFMSARDVLIEQDTLKSQGGRLGAQPSGLKRLGNTTNRSILSIKKNPVESEKSISNEQIDDRLKNIDPKMIEAIRNEIQCNVSRVAWDDIAGLDHAKKSIMEVS
jgi:SpoVK/Ycf46/Vps4 family AAA+-type ATPase